MSLTFKSISDWVSEDDSVDKKLLQSHETSSLDPQHPQTNWQQPSVT